MEYRIKFHQEGTHITSITLDRKGKGSGNAYFHGGECYALMLTLSSWSWKSCELREGRHHDSRQHLGG